MKITYKDKVALMDDETIPNENKVTAENMNEIREVVNNNADELESKQSKEEGKGLSTNDFTNELKKKLEDLNDYDDTQIKQEQITQNTKIQTLETDNATNKQEILELKQKNTEQDTKIKQNTDNIELLNNSIGDINTLLDQLNGEVV